MPRQLVIIIPAYNEERRIGDTLKNYIEYFLEHGKSLRLDVSYFIALNGCSDGTREVVERTVRVFRGVSVEIVEWKERIGKGGAIHNAFGMVEGDFVGYVDADNSTTPPEFAKLLLRLDQNQGAIASRWIRGAQVYNRKSYLRQVASRLFRFGVRMLFFMPYRDTQCGAKVFSMQIIRPLLGKLRVHDMAFDVELLYALHQRGITLAEVPTRWIAHDTGSSSLRSPYQILQQGLKMMRSLLCIRFNNFL